MTWDHLYGRWTGPASTADQTVTVAPVPEGEQARADDAMARLLATWGALARDPSRCYGCGHGRHTGACGRSLPGMGGRVCGCGQ